MRSYLQNLRLLAVVYLFGLLLFTLFRVGLLLSQMGRIAGLEDSSSLLLRAFWMGFRFDNVISCYILLLPLVTFSLTALFNYFSMRLNRLVMVYLCVFYVLSIILCVADIPYFDYFFKHINGSIFNWAGEKGFVSEMILEEPMFLVLGLGVIMLCIAYCWGVSRIYHWNYRQTASKKPNGLKNAGLVSLCMILLVGLCFIGIRGRLAKKSPIRIGTAYFSNNPFINQLGLNPVFYFMRSSIDAGKLEERALHLMPEEEAIRHVQDYFALTDTIQFLSPVARRVSPAGEAKPYNVVLIMMEGISAEWLTRNGGQSRLPFLDSLSTQCLYFDNAYSAGIHTMNGLCAGIFAYPALLTIHPFKEKITTMAGFPNVLREKGYQTIYFTTHDEQFDNVAGFLMQNQFARIVSEKDYPSERILSNLGVADDYMFEQALPILGEMASTGEPFLATIMTASNHNPFKIPDYYHPKPGSTRDQVLEYSDWALQQFFAQAKQESWYDQTIFVLCADHGNVVGPQNYEMSLSYHHVPLFILAPDIREPQVYTTPAGQIDIFPTVMGLLNLPYVNNTFGTDLLQQPREYIYFSADNMIGCISDTFFFVHTMDGREYLYDYRKQSQENLLEVHKEEAAAMKKYAFSMMQAAYSLYDRELTGLQ